ncbi:MAG: SPOR domain-containing protein [Candidatus Neomarinimicrobiota bacterium]
MRRLFFLAIIPVLVYSQDIAELKQKIDAGEADSVKILLPALREKYPANPEILYLSGLVESDGEAALLIYRDVLSQYPNSQVADDAFLKIVEYLFTKGLYAKTDKYARELIKKYPRSELIEKTVYLQLCSLNAMNQRDSVDYYYRYYSVLYPDANFQFVDYRSVSNLALTENRVQMESSSAPVTVKPQSRPEPEKKTTTAGKFTLQMGVFGTYNNALILQNKLERLGQTVTLRKINRSGRTLTVVLTGSFATEEEAHSAGEKLKREKKLDFVVVKK